ncbi:unnamed protein product [Polarella glacialis]|uniref:Uncharacterized protein n=1 Tax=Polarella glacialis TaxID=89957 RepID=A0A813HAA3_POLGL|nr:unnamed protein product [Polarella glacialis]
MPKARVVLNEITYSTAILVLVRPVGRIPGARLVAAGTEFAEPVAWCEAGVVGRTGKEPVGRTPGARLVAAGTETAEPGAWCGAGVTGRPRKKLGHATVFPYSLFIKFNDM